MKTFEYIALGTNDAKTIDADTWSIVGIWLEFYCYEPPINEIPQKKIVLAVRADALFSVGEVRDKPYSGSVAKRRKAQGAP